MNRAGATRDDHWPDAQQSRSVGSLLKPFLALSYLATHSESPVIECRGAMERCWLPQGHGRQDIVSALANSCNAYFLQLSANLNRAALDLTCLSYGLLSPPRSWSATRLIGLEDGWPQAPAPIVQAFAELARNRSDGHVQTVLAGMLRCSRSGTARAAGFACFAKTGTARCSHLTSGGGDGYALAMYPVDQPKFIVLVMRHNATGAHAAKDLKPLVDLS